MGIALTVGAQRLKLIGCIPLEQETVGFAIPVLVGPSDASLLAVQEIDEVTGRVCRFRSLDHPRSGMISVAAGPTVGVGEHQIYAFVITPTNVRVGTLTTLRSTLEHFAEANPSRSGLLLQIRELIGSDKEKKLARTEMRALLLEKQGAAAARSFYEGSVLRSVLWNRLLSMATNEKMSRRILEVRGRLSASVTRDGQIGLNLSALSEEDRARIDAAELISGILLEFEPQPVAPGKSTHFVEDQAHDAAEVQKVVDSLLKLVRQTGRQEERIALLMSAILGDPTVGKTALLQYQNDRAKTADWAVRELRKTFIDTNWSSDEEVIAGLVPRLFTKQWPMTRGDLLFFLAKHLGKWPLINQAIRLSLSKTHSMFVDWRRKEIEDVLSQSRSLSTSR